MAPYRCRQGEAGTGQGGGDGEGHERGRTVRGGGCCKKTEIVCMVKDGEFIPALCYDSDGDDDEGTSRLGAQMVTMVVIC